MYLLGPTVYVGNVKTQWPWKRIKTSQNVNIYLSCVGKFTAQSVGKDLSHSKSI